MDAALATHSPLAEACKVQGNRTAFLVRLPTSASEVPVALATDGYVGVFPISDGVDGTGRLTSFPGPVEGLNPPSRTFMTTNRWSASEPKIMANALAVANA